MSDISSAALIELALDLANSLVSKDRFDRLLSTVRKTIPCDAVVLLSRHSDHLKPLALQGLTRDTLGRRFHIAEHPRFEILCRSDSPVRFDAESMLPDPYDGLLMAQDGDLPVHACMGLPLLFDDYLIGLLTLDSLTPNVFDDIPKRTLDIVSAMSAATLKTAVTLELLENRASQSQEIVAELTHEALVRDGGELIGDSPAMLKLKQEMQIVAPSEFTILITGETGVGKELVARTLHRQSLRADGPLVYVNCAALPENLIESELFGHIKGAFTGAERNRAGKFSIADGGTLFLDEVGELPPAAQSKLLRVLQNREIQPVGQDNVQHVDVRILAATNRDLTDEVKKGHFRADLFHRLSVYPICVPPLRDREGDVQLLAGYFVEQVRRKLGIQQLKLGPDAVSYLTRYDWPGNVRELEHIIGRAALRARSEQSEKSIVSINSTHCGTLVTAQPARNAEGPFIEVQKRDERLNLKEATTDFQRQLITKVLSEEKGSWAAAARRLETDRANLSRLAKRLGIRLSKMINTP